MLEATGAFGDMVAPGVVPSFGNLEMDRSSFEQRFGAIFSAEDDKEREVLSVGCLRTDISGKCIDVFII